MIKGQLDPDAVPDWLSTLWPPAGRDPRIVAGVNEDDCAVMRWGEEYVVLTVDFLNSRPIAIQLGLGGLAEVGRLLVAANLADLCGTGAEPRALLIGATLERSASEEDFRNLMQGVHAEATRWGVPVVGGDTKLGADRALLAVALGSAQDLECLFLKSGGKAGDLLWCSGALGACNAAVLGLTHQKMPEEWQQWAKDSILIPNLPLAKSRAVSRARLGHAGIDISDGLGADLKRLCDASHVGAVVEAQRIPVEGSARDVAALMGIEPWALAFGCGGDFQFLVSTSREAMTAVEDLGFSLIGELTEAPEIRLRLSDGADVPLPESGHRDARNASFTDEILELVTVAAQVAEA